MCLIVYQEPKFKTAKKAITVWKIIRKRSKKRKGRVQYESSVVGQTIPRNGVINPAEKFSETTVAARNFSHLHGVTYNIEGGVIHSCSSRRYAIDNHGLDWLFVVKCKIPKGAKYFKYGSIYVSSKLKMFLSTAKELGGYR